MGKGLVNAYTTATTISEFLAAWFEDESLAPDVREEISAYYHNFVRCFDSRLRYFYDRQVLEVENLLKAKARPQRLLELGCGLGTESLWFALRGARVTSVDPKKEWICVARKRLDILQEKVGRKLECDFVLGSLFSALEGPFDLLWMEQAFHHIEPRELATKRIFDLVKPGGHLVISEANGANPLLQLQLLRRRGLKTIGTYRDEAGELQPYGVERVLSGNRMRHLMEDAGFATESISHFRCFPSGPGFARFFPRERNWKGRPAWVATHYNYVGRRPA